MVSPDSRTSWMIKLHNKMPLLSIYLHPLQNIANPYLLDQNFKIK